MLRLEAGRVGDTDRVQAVSTSRRPQPTRVASETTANAWTCTLHIMTPAALQSGAQAVTEVATGSCKPRSSQRRENTTSIGQAVCATRSGSTSAVLHMGPWTKLATARCRRPAGRKAAGLRGWETAT